MRLLLIDNHDSFTAILHHYLWELAGERPLLFRNDELTRDELERLDFDAAVLSPGPGHPANVRDFGVCRDLLELFPATPVLGVCLGMQGLAQFAGGRVVPWPGALHGRPARIAHDGSGVFRGLPDGFRAIRYHSLVVDPDSLSATVRATAWADDGGERHVMGLAFTDRPWHGVQFHPEAFATEHGKTLLTNFLDLASPGRTRPAPVFSTGRGREADTGEGLPRDLPEVPHIELPWRDPAQVFTRFFSGVANTFWLDGAHARQESGWASTAMGRAETARNASAAWFRTVVSAYAGISRRCPWPGYRGGPVGQLDYEWRPEATEPEAGTGRWLLPDGWLSFDHRAGRVFAAWNDGAEPPAWLQRVITGWTQEGSVAAPVAALPSFDAWVSSMTEARHAEAVAALQDAIARGDTYEACLTFKYEVSAVADPLGVYLGLRARNPAPYSAYFDFGGFQMLSASPELFLEGSADGTLRSRPIKGTRRRGGDPASDRALREDLSSSEKDAAENRMITDLTRHDLARVCVPGSVEVPVFLSVEEHPAVFQLVSEVRGRIAPDRTAFDAIAACFPGGSMTGAPKERTMELLRKLEALRGAYSGAMGYVTDGGAFTLSMVIRTLVAEGNNWSVGCGGAVLADSTADSEWREAMIKARSVIDAAGP